MPSNIYEQLNTKSVGEAPSTSIATVSDPLKIQETNAEYLSQVSLINQATFRQDSGPIPGQTKIIQASRTDSGSKVAVFTPARGESWQICAVYYEGMSGGSGNITQVLWFWDNKNTESIAWKQTTSSDAAAVWLEGTNEGPIFDENITLQWQSTRSSLSAGDIFVMLQKIR